MNNKNTIIFLGIFSLLIVGAVVFAIVYDRKNNKNTTETSTIIPTANNFRRFTGEQGIKKLSEESSCKLPSGQGVEMDNFAKCLTEKGFVMYGAYWCAHCLNEKKGFGDSFKYIKYVECTEEVNKCLAAGVEGYPTWIVEK